MRTLGIDIGTKRIGLALSDVEGTFAFPSGRIDRLGRAKDLEALDAFISEHEVLRIVVGLPIQLDGREGAGAKAARKFASELATRSGRPVDLLDERLTTVEAERVLHASGRNTRKQREVVDSVAASIILRTYLDSVRNRAALEGDDG